MVGDWWSVVFTVFGNIGVVCFLAAFFLLQKGTLKSDDYRYLSLNLAGAILLMISLWWDWNLSAFLLEACWALISCYGIYKRATPTTGYQPPTTASQGDA